MQVKTIRYQPQGGAHLIDIDVGEPGPGQVQVEGTACGICAWDLQTFKAGTDQGYAAPPGHEGVGYISKLGEGVEGIEVGQKVAGGGFARLRNMAVDRLYLLPDSKLEDKHWIVEPVSCVITGIDHCQLQAGDRVALIGAGFMGLMILQGLAGSYADQIIALDVEDSRLELAQRLGATESYNTRLDNFADIAADLQQRGIDTTIDTTGAQAALDLAGEITQRGGRINLFGWIKGQQAHFNPSQWHLKGLSIVNSAPGSKLRDPYPAAIRLLASGKIDLRQLVTHTVPLAEYPDFMQAVTSGEVKGYIKGVVEL